MIFSHFQITFQQAGSCISPVTLRSRGENAHLLVNPIPKLTIVLIWKTPACLKFGKTSNRGVEIWHKENSESEQRTMHVLIRIWSHRTSASVCFFGNDRSSHSRIRISLDPMSVYTTSERVTNLHILVPASWYALTSPRVQNDIFLKTNKKGMIESILSWFDRDRASIFIILKMPRNGVTIHFKWYFDT